MIKYPNSFYSSVSKRAIESSEIVGRVLQEVINPLSVIDIGSGEGIWLSTMSRFFPDAKALTAIDLQSHESQYFLELASSNPNFRFIERNFELNCTLPDERFDLAICLEVLEHLKKETAERLVSEITKGTSLIVFSAAMKGQGGTGHINEHSIEYWVKLLEFHDYVPLDVFRKELAKNASVPDYYKQNMLLFWHPKNSQLNKTEFNLEQLLIKNHPPISDTRGALKKMRYFLASFIPPRFVTILVLILDKTIRK
jgi:hypothetical protein